MGATPIARLLSIVISGRKKLIEALRYLVSQSGGKIFQTLAFLFNILRGTLRGREHLLAKDSAKHPALPAETAKSNTLFFDTGPEISGFELTLETNGEKISMDDVAFSSYPSSSTPANRFSTSWTQLHFRQPTETVVSEARSTSTVIERTEYSSRWESNVTSTLILSQAGTTTFFKHPRIMPIMPEGSRRYKNWANGDNRKFNSRLERVNIAKHPLSAGWAQCTHPDGAIYFCNREKRIFTDANIYDTVLYQQMLEDISTIEEFVSTHGITLPSNCDLVLDVTYNNACQEIQTFYYFVHHPSRSIFFLDNYEAPWCELKGINSSSHLREELEAQYWLYLQLCPHAIEISSSLIFEIRDTVLQFIGDRIASQSSATIYSMDELYRFLALIENLEKNQGRESNGAVGLLSRLMHSFAQSRVYDSQGKLQPRLKNEIQVVTYAVQASRRTWFIRIISPFMFFSPNLYLRTLRRMWVIGATHNAVWDQGVTRLRHEWRERIFWSILMLIANAAFLGIRDIGLRHPELEHRSGAQISSYVSVVFAVGSIFLGMTFHEHILANSRDLIGDVSAYTKRHAYSLVGLEARAVVYSLPYVFLIWSIIAFATAFGFLIFQDTRRVTRVIVGIFAAAIAVLVVIGVTCSWERYTEQESALPPNESRPKSPEKANITEDV